MQQLRRVAIVNRTEAAMRLIHAVRELNARGGDPIETIALYTESEPDAMFAREADHAYPLGPAAARPYLDHAILARALQETKADAAWVGWGFVAEDPVFAELCERLGVVFVGPTPEAMRQLGDKIGAKQLAEKVGVPMARWSGGGLPDLESALASANRIGYPLMLKAAAGGGGRGIRRVTNDTELREVFDRTRAEAMRAFGSDVVFLEGLVSHARHIEVQLIADGQGTAWALGVRDCSVQRRNQKVLEESASPLLRPEQAQSIKDAAVRLALEVGYRGAGTVEFLYTPQTEEFAFLEVNTRLQVEHPVTELTTGADLVALQLHIAAGGRLEGTPPAEFGHAVEARLNAEDPDRDFAPAPGRITILNLPTGPGLRIDTGVAEGDEIPSDFDSMIAKVIAYGTTREQAFARLRRALQDTTVVIEGGTTNKSFLLSLLDQPAITRGEPTWADTGWIDRERAAGGLASPRHSGIALIAAGVAAYQQAEFQERVRFLTTANGGRPQAQHEDTREFQLGLRGGTHAVVVSEVGPARYRVDLDGFPVEVGVERLGRYAHRLTVDGQNYRVVTANQPGVHVVEVDASLHRVTRDSGGVISSPAPALVVAVSVALGDEVAAGDTVAVLESMKMETLIPAPYAGRVRELSVSAGDQVRAGGPLLVLEPVEEGTAGTSSVEIDFELPIPESDVSTVELARGALTDVRHLLLGFDIPPEQGRELVAEYQRLRDESGIRLLEEELSVLSVFADLAELSRNRPSAGDPYDDRVHSPREFFHQYLHTLDADRERLPDTFRDRLSRALAHYGVHDLTRSVALEEAVYRVFLAQQRANAHVPSVMALLEAWLADPAPSDDTLRSHTQDVLDRLVTATQLRHPTVGNLARSIRYRWFEAPLAAAESAKALAAIRHRMKALDTSAPDYPDQIDWLTTCPEPLVNFVGERISGHSDVPISALLDIMARRHYREHTLDALALTEVDNRTVLSANYTLDDRPTYLVSMVGDVGELIIPEPDPDAAPSLVGAISEAIAKTPAGHQIVIDLYLTWAQAPAAEADVIEQLRVAWEALPFAGSVRRAAMTVFAGPERVIRQFTLRPERYGSADPGGIVEDSLVRGVHPMVGRRLELWRLRDFNITRLEAPKEVLLYRCVAPENESDIRLVALAQIRELTIVRDSSGQISGLPQAERVLSSCVDAIRRARVELTTGRGARRQVLDNNHVWLHVWPEITDDVEQLTAMRQTIAPLTQGAGLSEVTAQAVVRNAAGERRPMTARFTYQPGTGVKVDRGAPPQRRLATMDEVDQKILRSRRRGTIYPYELIKMLTAERRSTFVEYDLEPQEQTRATSAWSPGSLVPVDRAPGQNTAGIVVGIVSTPNDRYGDEGMRRVVLIGDPTMALGAVAEPECARVVAALDLAQRESLPVEWFTLSAGARIAMDSGTENMDWVARALRRIIEFTQAGGEINIVVTGINVGAQPYWNAEATMLMHTKGILVMTPESAMVLTGKTSLDYSGGVSAEDNFGIGGYDRVMGPNGQAQYWAPDLARALEVLKRHYEHSYVAPGEQRTRATTTADPVDRNVCDFPHPEGDSGFTTVGHIFSPLSNPERKKPFDIRTVLRAVSDSDHPTLERWAAMADADTCVVLDAHLGGQPVTLLGIESKTVARQGFPPTDGPEVWTAGTLFPRSSKKAARAINAASGSRPVVILANLSGFDGSPESMRQLQLEYGAEIGRAVTNFDGPIVFCVISRYHGGAFVVFSKALNDRMQVLAVQGSFASVIGGAPAAGVVFTAEVDARTAADPRVRTLERYLAKVSEEERTMQMGELVELRAQVRSEKLREVAIEFDSIHSIERAVQFGSVDAIIASDRLRPELIAAVQRGLAD